MNNLPTNKDVQNILIGLSILIRYDPNVYFDTDFCYPSLEFYANVLLEDLTNEEIKTMTNCDWIQLLDGKGDIWWQYDFSRRYYD